MTRVFEHNINSTAKILDALPMDQVTHVLLKELPKNANDKNQIYWSADFNMLGTLFSLEYGERDFSSSRTKPRSNNTKKIPEAVFNDFKWLDTEGNLVSAPNVKMLIYAQYPEMRLSGFKTTENQIPLSLSIEHVKENIGQKRILVLARTRTAAAIAMMIYPTPALLDEITSLENFKGSRVVKVLAETSSASDELRDALTPIVGNNLPGVRLDKDGETLPFNGTQVCGYTLEHALGIRPNSDQNGDYQGIELKTHTSKKVTLMTPEPDMGEYSDNFNKCLKERGYWDKKSESYRLTGVHRAGVRCEKTGLTLKVENYDASIGFSSQLDKDIHIGLYDDANNLVAGWSKEKILNLWGAKHNETVYIKAQKSAVKQEAQVIEGAKFNVNFDRGVAWCKESSPERLLKAIIAGVVIFDPAPKYVPKKPSDSKRRSQWRVNDIYKAIQCLYESVEFIDL